MIHNATITAPDGSRIQRNLVRLTLTDGGRGDSDLLENGVIVDPGAPVVVAGDDGGSGALHPWLLLSILLVPAGIGSIARKALMV